MSRNRRAPAARQKPPNAKNRSHRRTGSSHQFLIPDDDEINAQLKKLRPFEPADTQQLLADARALSDGKTTVDAAIVNLYAERLEAQATQLVNALGLQLNKPTVWFEAFIKLAQIHHHVGRLVHRKVSRQTGPRTGPRKRFEDDELLSLVALMRQQGSSEREATRKLAAKRMFTTQERRDHKGRRHSDKLSARDLARARAVDALRRRYHRAKKRKEAEAHQPGLAGVFGSPDGAFEAMLWLLENPLLPEASPLPQPFPRGDNVA